MDQHQWKLRDPEEIRRLVLFWRSQLCLAFLVLRLTWMCRAVALRDAQECAPQGDGFLLNAATRAPINYASMDCGFAADGSGGEAGAALRALTGAGASTSGAVPSAAFHFASQA